jgi:putative photosynthetic complex assembly protein 2
MTSPLLAAFAVLLAWWLSTGLILWRVRVADNGPAHGHMRSVIGGLPLLGFGMWGTIVSAADPSAFGVYLGFAAALALWGWVELAFLSGVLTGPNHVPSPTGLHPRARFARALLAVAWHELALAAIMIGLIWAQWGGANTIAAATFALLLIARTLAKINLFLGVPRINLQFVPRPIAHIKSHFRLAPATGFLWISIGILGIITTALIRRALTAAPPENSLGYTVLAALAALALLEHLFMVLPLPDAKLWAWMLPKAKPSIKTLKE